MKRRHFILLLGGAGSGAMSVGSQAFSSVEAERGVNVNVADDANAYVGYEKLPNSDGTVENGDSITLVRVRNQFAGGTSIGVVGVDIDDAGKDVLENVRIETNYSDQSGENSDTEEISRNFSTGEAAHTFEPPGFADIIAEVDRLNNGEKVNIEVTIEVKGSSVAAEIFGDTRSFAIERKSLDEYDYTVDWSSQGEGKGAGGTGIKIEPESDKLHEVSAKVRYKKPSEKCDKTKCMFWTDFKSVLTGTRLKLKDDFDGPNNGYTIKAVEIENGPTIER